MTDPKKIGARLEKCAKKKGIRQSKDKETSNIPYGIDQSTLSKWYGGTIPKPYFAAFCTHVGMSFDDVPNSVEKYIPETIEPKDAKILESIISDLVTLEQRGYPMQVTATQLKSALTQGERDPVPAEERSMLEGLDRLALAQIQKGLGLVLGAVPAGSSEYTACMHALHSVGLLGAPQEPKRQVPSSEEGQSQPQADGI